MVLVKTKEFDIRFQQDKSWLEINRRIPLLEKGSYKVKEWGDIVTDIDLQAHVYFNSRLLDIIANVVSKNRRYNSPFIFMYMSVGKYDGYEVPWNIDESGDCDYNPEKVKVWWEEFKNTNLIPKDIKNYIFSKLFSDNMRISKLIDVENALHPYAEILWTENDIRKGFIDNNGKRYYLLHEMKTETPVLEYIYNYQNNEYVSIDVGLVDKKFAIPPIGKMYRYYTQDWYKIMKSFRWKIPTNKRTDYFKVMNEITILISLKHQLNLIQKLIKHKILSSQRINDFLNATYTELNKLSINYKGKQLNEIENYLYEEVNKKLENNVLVYANKIQDPERKKILNRLIRGAQAQIPVMQDQLLIRHRAGIQCPFFAVELNEYEKLTALAMRLDINVDLVVNCFSQIAIQLRKSVSQLTDEVIHDNGLSLLEIGGEVILRENGKERGKYMLSDKKKVQMYVLLK